MWSRFLLVFSIATGLQAQQDPADLLRLVQATIAESVNRLPKYMCTETIDRSRYEPGVPDRRAVCDDSPTRPGTRLTTSDRLWLDVTKGMSFEMYSWVGESRFDDRDLLDMVHEGAISTGSFGAYLTAIFHTEDTSFTYNGDEIVDGRSFSEFGFRVPREKSHYSFYGEGQQGLITGYSGTFLVDPKTGDLTRLVVDTSRLPMESGLCYAASTLDYSRVQLKGADFLLPSVSVLRIVHADGGESVNRTVFSNCHEFLGESTILFHPAPDVPERGAGAGASRVKALPEGLSFRVALTEGIDTATSAGGDPIKAKLLTPIERGSKVLVPAGAPVTARIVRLREFYGSASAVVLDIKLETVGIGGVSVGITAIPDTGRNFQKAKAGALRRRVELGTLRGLTDRSISFEFRNVSLPYLIGSGLESLWVTAAPAPGNPASTQMK